MDVARLASAFPESPGTPQNRHVGRWRLQQAGLVRAIAAWLADLFAVAGARRRGIGRRLVEAAEMVAVSHGASRLGLEVTASNSQSEGARLLYAGVGFVDAGVGEFVSGYSYWTPDGVELRDEEPHTYLIKEPAAG